MTGRDDLPGGFFLHPVFVTGMAVTLINNLWLKPSGVVPLLAGKLSDCAIMVFLPALICLGMAFVRHQIDGTVPRRPSRRLVLAAIAISAVAMIALQLSEPVSDFYDVVLAVSNRVLFFGRVPARATPDPTDLVSLLFLIIPYRVLLGLPLRMTRSGSEERLVTTGAVCGRPDRL